MNFFYRAVTTLGLVTFPLLVSGQPDGDAESREFDSLLTTVESESDGSSSTAPVADDADAAPKRAKVGSRLIEEIVVTAQKREEDLSDVPISVQAFSAEALDARGITDQSGLMKATAGLDIGVQAGYATVFLRGIGTEAWMSADPSVASYVDGVYFPFAPSMIQEFGAIERVEVLKGPQGTLFGRNAVGGAINVITKLPSFTERETHIEVGYQNYNTMGARIFANIPVSETFALNTSAYYRGADSFLEDATSAGGPLHRETSKGARIRARWAPTENLDMTFSAVRTHAQGNGSFPVLSPSPLARILGIPDSKPYESHINEKMYLSQDSTVLAGELTYYMPWFNIKLLASDQYNTSPYNYDFDGSQKELVMFDIPVHYADIQEAEIQFLSNESLPVADWLTVTAGMFYFKNLQGFDPLQLTAANLDPTRLEAGGIAGGLLDLVPGLSDSLEAIFGAGGQLIEALTNNNIHLPALGAPLYNVSAVALMGTDSLSQYLQLTAKVTDWFSLTLGGRYQSEERGVEESTTSVNIPGITEVALFRWQNARDANGLAYPLSATTRKFSPKISLDFRPFEDETLIYFNYQEATKAHAYNALAIYLRPAYVKPEDTRAYEIGIKTPLFGGATRLSASAWYYEIDNMQSMFISLLNGGAVAFENAGSAVSKGFDFDITSELFPSVIDGLAVTINGAFIDAYYTDYRRGAGFDETTGLFSNLNDYTGNRATRSPEFTAAVALTKAWAVPGGRLEAGVDYYYNDGFFYTASNDPKFAQPAYSLLGGFVGYTYEPADIRVTLFGKNILDEYYTAGIITTDFGANRTVAPPAQYGIKINIGF